MTLEDHVHAAAETTLTEAAATTLSSPPPAKVLPPELIELILPSLSRAQLLRVLTLNWTWAYLVACELWRSLHLTAHSTQLVFLITKSVPSVLAFPSTAATGFGNMTTRKSSYPWPTLLPYHAMVQSLTVSLSNSDMIQDLVSILESCAELRVVNVESVIPVEDLIYRNGLNTRTRDGDNNNGGQSGADSPIATTPGNVRIHLHTENVQQIQSPHENEDNDNIEQGNHTRVNNTPKELPTLCSGIFILLAQKCPKLKSLQLNKFDNLAVLGSAKDLAVVTAVPAVVATPRPTTSTTTCSSTAARTINLSSTTFPQSSKETKLQGTNIDNIHGDNNNHNDNNNNYNNITTKVNTPISKSQIQEIRLDGCKTTGYYLLSMVQESNLPNLQELNLYKSRCDYPITGRFLRDLPRVCPRLKVLRIHCTYVYRNAIQAGDVLTLLQGFDHGVKAQRVVAARRNTNTVLETVVAAMVGGGGEAEMVGGIGGGGHGNGGDDEGVGFEEVHNNDHDHDHDQDLFNLDGVVREQDLDWRLVMDKDLEESEDAEELLERNIADANYYSRYPDHQPSTSSSLGSSLSTGQIHHHQHHQHHHHHGTSNASNSSIGTSINNNNNNNNNNSHLNTNHGQSSSSNSNHHNNNNNNHNTTTNNNISYSDLEVVELWIDCEFMSRELIEEVANKNRHPKLKRIEFGSDVDATEGPELIDYFKELRPELDAIWSDVGEIGGDNYD